MTPSPTVPVSAIAALGWCVAALLLWRSDVPLPFKIIAWIVAIVVGAWSFFQAIEYFAEKYQAYGPGVRQTAHGWWLASPKTATAAVALIFGIVAALLAGTVFWYVASKAPATLPSSASSEREADAKSPSVVVSLYRLFKEDVQGIKTIDFVPVKVLAQPSNATLGLEPRLHVTKDMIRLIADNYSDPKAGK